MGRRGRAAALGAGLLLAAGCASSPPPAVEAVPAAEAAQPVEAEHAGDVAQPLEAEQAVEAAHPAARAYAVDSPDAAPPATTPRRPPAAEPVRRQLIVIDEGSSEVRPEPGELARSTRRDAAASPGGAPRVTNDNLADYARRGRVSMSGTAAAPEEGAAPGEEAAAGQAAATETAGNGEAAVASAGGADPREPLRDEAWWRARVRQVREEWRQTVDEIAELEETAADLRWRYYAADDPWVRDGRVKPEWDRALDRLSEARRRLGEYPRRLEALLEEGRREGALPGWLREGVELEPRPEELPAAEPDPAEPVEPRQVDQEQRGREQ